MLRKYLVIICDGMSDLPIDSLAGKTVLDFSGTPNMDRIASAGICGIAQTVPEGMPPGSDTANLSIFGYNPRKYFTGRAPLEAINMGIDLGEHDAAFRFNFVTLNDSTMIDFCADHIENDFAKVIISEFNKINKNPDFEFYPGVSYRNLMVWRNYPYANISSTTPPHDIQGREYKNYLPKGDGSKELFKLMKCSQEMIASSEIIKTGAGKFKGKPDSFWIWGGGRKPIMNPYLERFGLSGVTISAVDLINGIGKAAGLVPVKVEGATGYLDTNYEGKADAAFEALLKGADIAFVHLESPDESGHEGNIDHKKQAIEDIDSRVVGRLFDKMNSAFEDYSLLILPDHATPVSLKTHSSDLVPFCFYSSKGIHSTGEYGKVKAFSEKEALSTGLVIDDASVLISCMIRNEI